MPNNSDKLPSSFAPRGLSRVQSAAYIGTGTTTFDEMVKDGRMPPPKRVNSRKLWDRFELDAAFGDLPSAADANPWDDEVLHDDNA